MFLSYIVRDIFLFSYVICHNRVYVGAPDHLHVHGAQNTNTYSIANTWGHGGIADASLMYHAV